MRTLHRFGTGLIVLTLVASACGSDDDKTASSTDGSPSGENASFCDALVEFNGAVTQVELDDTSTEADIKAAGEQLGPLFETVATNAPDAVSTQAEALNRTVQSLRDGDAAAFNDEATFETYTDFLDGSVGSCDFDSLDVTAKDYAFDAPDTVPAGTVALSLTNSSEAEDHEMIIFRRADGVDLSFQEILGLGEKESAGKIQFSGAAFAPKGESSSSLANLEAGDYAMVCFIPVGGKEDGPPHFTQGMIHEFTVS